LATEIALKEVVLCECILHCVSKLYNFLTSNFVAILYTKIIEIGSFFNELFKKNVDVF